MIGLLDEPMRVKLSWVYPVLTRLTLDRDYAVVRLRGLVR